MSRRRIAGHPVVIEIIGPAGAGKSALAKWLVDHVGTMAIVPRAHPRRDLLVYLGAAVRLGPTAFEAIRLDPRFAGAQLRHLLRLETLRTRLAATTTGDVTVALFDEGPLYSLARSRAFWPPRLTGGPVDDYLRRSLRGWVAEIDIAISLDAPNPVLAQRIDARAKHHRMRGHADDAVFAFLDRYRAAYASVLADAARVGTLATLEIDTAAQSVALSGARVLAAIRDRRTGDDIPALGRRTIEPDARPMVLGI